MIYSCNKLIANYKRVMALQIVYFYENSSNNVFIINLSSCVILFSQIRYRLSNKISHTYIRIISVSLISYLTNYIIVTRPPAEFIRKSFYVLCFPNTFKVGNDIFSGCMCQTNTVLEVGNMLKVECTKVSKQFVRVYGKTNYVL